MFHSYRLRLSLVMIALPVIALLSVGLFIGRNASAQLNDYVVARNAFKERRMAFEQKAVEPQGLFVLKVPVDVDGNVAAGAWASPLADLAPVPVTEGAIAKFSSQFVAADGAAGATVDRTTPALEPEPEPRLFVLRLDVGDEGTINAADAAAPLEQFGPVPVDDPISIVSGDVGEFQVLAGPGLVPALEETRADTIGSMNRYIIIAVTLAGASAAAAAFFISRGATLPVEALTAAARSMEAGDLSHRVAVRTQDEFGELAHAFNAMADRIEQDTKLRRRMASDVAHELRTPLNNLSGYLDAIADGVVQPDAGVISSLQQEADALVRLVRDVEQLSLADSGELPLLSTEVDVRDVVARGVSAAAARAAERAIELRCDAVDGPMIVHGDADRLSQVLRNLLDNALTHTPAGGAIVVRTTAQAEVVRMIVEDSGPGISELDLPHVFDRFYRADASRSRATGGAGLGLAIVRKIVEAHGGSVEAKNAEDGGARLTVSLPRLPSSGLG
jgi:signal transduction histidine kinase